MIDTLVKRLLWFCAGLLLLAACQGNDDSDAPPNRIETLPPAPEATLLESTPEASPIPPTDSPQLSATIDTTEAASPTPLPYTLTPSHTPSLVPSATFVPLAEDALENPAHTGVIYPGESFDASLEADNLTVEWELLLTTPNILIFQLGRISGEGILTLQVRQDEEVLVMLQTNEQSFVLTDLLNFEAGSYQMLLSAEEPMDYQISIIPKLPVETPVPSPTLAPSLTPRAAGGRIEVGQSIEGAIVEPGEVQRYTFLGNTGDELGMLVNPDPNGFSTFDPYLELQAPNGDIIAENDQWRAGIPDAFISATLEVTGVYTLYVQSADGEGEGSYILSLSDGFTLRDVPRGEAPHNVPISERLETYGARDIWTIEASAGDILQIDVRAFNQEQLNVMVELLAPNGESWFDDDSGDGTDALLEGIEAPLDGSYTIHVAARNNAFIGSYQLFWRRQNQFITPTALPSQTPTPSITPRIPTPGPNRAALEDSITAVGNSVRYSIQLQAGQTVNIVVQGVAGFDPVLRVLDATDNILLEVDDAEGSQNPRSRFTAERSGIYVLQISGFENSTGSFTLNYIVQ